MADFGAIFSVISRGTSFALRLNKFTATARNGRKDLSRVAKSIRYFCSAVKQLSTIIRDDDTLISSEAVESLEHILDQCNTVLTEIEAIVFAEQSDNHGEPGDDNQSRGSPLKSAGLERLAYLGAHLEALEATISTLQQTLYTAQSIKWAKDRPAISPQQAAAAVDNEKNQLENIVIEQQTILLRATKLYKPSGPEARLLMEKESSWSLVARESGPPNPGDLHRYQERFLATLDTSDVEEEEWILLVCSISRSHLDRLLERWTRLRQFHESIADEELRANAERRYSQQPTVESVSDEEIGGLPKLKTGTARLVNPTPGRPGSVQPLFTESATLPIPVPSSKYGPLAPSSPVSSYGVSPRSSGNRLASPAPSANSPVSPRSSISSLPVEATAAVKAKDEDEDAELGIPWKLCIRKFYWEYIDGEVRKSNTTLAPQDLEANVDPNSRTEILASWVHKDAIKEQKYQCTQIQKEKQDGRRTKFETCFLIHHPLTYDQVRQLVERTVEIVSQTRASTPPPNRRSSNDKPEPLSRDKTPVANRPIPLDRPTTHAYPPPPPPRTLERSISVPTPMPPYPASPSSVNGIPPHQIPLPSSPYTRQQPWPQQAAAHPPLGVYPPSAAYPPQPQFNHHFMPTGTDPRIDPRRLSNPLPPQPNLFQTNQFNPHLPLRSSHSRSKKDDYLSSTTSDSDTATPRARDKHRPRSRRGSSSSTKKKHSTVGTLAKVGGLATLLDIVVEAGVL